MNSGGGINKNSLGVQEENKDSVNLKVNLNSPSNLANGTLNSITGSPKNSISEFK